jgi:hypothetical protein
MAESGAGEDRFEVLVLGGAGPVVHVGEKTAEITHEWTVEGE